MCLLHFWNVHEISSSFEKKMSIQAQLFPKLFILKDVVTSTSKSTCFRTLFGNERVTGFQTLLKSARHHYYPLFSSIRGKLSWKKCALVRSEILRLFVSTLTADDKYFDSNMQNLPQQFQAQLSQKQKIFSAFLIAFLKFGWNLEHFLKKDEYSSLIISGVVDSERPGYLNLLKVLLQNTIR